MKISQCFTMLIRLKKNKSELNIFPKVAWIKNHGLVFSYYLLLSLVIYNNLMVKKSRTKKNKTKIHKILKLIFRANE